MTEQETIHQLASDLIDKLGYKADISVEPRDEGYYVHIKTEEDVSLLIGYHAQTLRGLQRILSLMVFKRLDKKVPLIVDINDYRAAQKERLEKVAEDVVAQVKTEGRAARLSSFSAYERKIIHEFISTSHPDLTSHSEGEGEDRILVIEMKAV